MKSLRYLLALAATAAFAQAVPAPAPEPALDDDPFRWLEDASSARSQEFYREQGAKARATLDRMPERAAILERIRALSEAGPRVTDVKLGGKRVFYLKISARQATPVLCMREGLAGAEQVVVDPERFARGPIRAAIDWYAPSPDGRHVAYGVSLGGSEDSVLRVIAVDARRDLGVEIDRTRFNAALAWQADGRGFYYARVPAGNSGARRYANIRLYHHVLSRDAAKDEIVFAPGVGGARDVPEFVYPSLHVPLDSKWAYAIARDGVRREIAVHVAEQSDLAKGRPRWRKLAGYEDEVVEVEGWKDDLFVLTHKGAPNLHVVRVKPTAAMSTAKPVVPEGDAVIQDMALAHDAIYLRTMVGGVDRLEKTPIGLFGAKARQFVRLPFDNAISQMVASPRLPGVLVRMEGWIEPPAIVQVDVKGELHKTGLQPPPPIDLSSMDAVRLHARSHDGATIPITLVYRKSTTLNGRNPTLLTAYGSFGVTLAPTFDPALMAWLERGGVYAIAHVRGGGEYGMAWHLSGMRAQKANTVLDFIAVADFICKYGFTSPAHLAALGTGAGGIPVGGALVRRPDLFAAVVERVPMADMVRMEETPQGPANVPEFGSAASSAGAAALRAISPYHQVKRAAYPGVLITAGVNDPRMALWQPAKLAARLQSATTSGRPVLLRIEESGGSPASREQHDEELADIYAFVLWQFDEASRPQPPVAPAPSPAAPVATPAEAPPSAPAPKDAAEPAPK